MSKDSKDLFKEGLIKSVAKKALSDQITNDKADNQPEENNKVISEEDYEKIKSMADEGATDWDVLKNMIEGRYAKRFMKALDSMPDKDFVRNYLKVLEHFKPKLMREEGKGQIEDSTINIITHVMDEKGNVKTIDMRQVNEEDNVTYYEQDDENV